MLLPQEIIDLIVDQVSAEGRTSQLMKTCSLVSHSFHARVRIHLFSRICLWIRICGYQGVARKFIKILKYKKNSDLISHIRSVNIFVHLHSQTYSQQQRSSKRLLKLIGIETSPIKTALIMLKNAPIEEFILRGDPTHCYFRNHRTSTLLLEMCSNPNIKNLRIEGLKDVPYRFIIGNGQDRSLTRLALHNVTISDYWFDIPPPTVVPTAAGIETLELVGMTLEEFLKALRCLSRQLPFPISECCKNLKNLVISLPQERSSFEARNEVWNVILGAAETLESLELCLSNAWHLNADPNTFDIRPFCLDPLKSLRRLKIISLDDWRRPMDFRNELIFMKMILASSASPIHVRSVILETHFGDFLARYLWTDVTANSILSPDIWSPIDRILTSPKFVDLHTVEVRLNGELRVYDYYFRDKILFALGEVDFTALLPTISSHPMISLIASTSHLPKRRPWMIDDGSRN